jgi:hypothetical protein
MKSDREIEILFRRLRLYDQLGRQGEGRVMEEGLGHVRSEIEHMRVQVGRQRKEILQLQKAGISTSSADALLERMLNKIDGLCAQRDTLKKEQPAKLVGVLGGRSW